MLSHRVARQHQVLDDPPGRHHGRIGGVEQLIRTLKENPLWVRTFPDRRGYA